MSDRENTDAVINEPDTFTSRYTDEDALEDYRDNIYVMEAALFKEYIGYIKVILRKGYINFNENCPKMNTITDRYNRDIKKVIDGKDGYIYAIDTNNTQYCHDDWSICTARDIYRKLISLN